MTSITPQNFPALTRPEDISELLRAMDGYKGSFIVYSALQFSALTFVRPGEIRHAEWEEIDWDKELWHIPAHKMKKKRDHLVPLSHQSLSVLKDLHPLTGPDGFIFPSTRSNKRPMSDGTAIAALRRMGYSNDTIVPHGFRTMASTNLHEHGWDSKVIEMQLAHVDSNKVRGIYNKAEYLDERHKMMQWWANFLDGLRKKKGHL